MRYKLSPLCMGIEDKFESATTFDSLHIYPVIRNEFLTISFISPLFEIYLVAIFPLEIIGITALVRIIRMYIAIIHEFARI